MDFFKFIGKFFGGILIFLSLALLFTGLFIHYSLENLNVISESIATKLPVILQENKELFAESLLKEKTISKSQLTRTCLEDPEELTEEFCANLGGMSEEEAKSELANVLLIKVQEDPQIQEFEQSIRIRFEEANIPIYLKYVTPVSIFIFLLASFVILLAEKFNWKTTMFYVSLKTGTISAFISLGNYFATRMTSESFENLVRNISAAQGEAPELALKLMSAMLTDWINIVSTKLFFISIIIAIVSFSVATLAFILKCKRKKAEVKKKVKKETKEKPIKKIKKVSKSKKK